ncbi:F-box protein At5g49610-like [Aegilops tauschii subsp. strangulata]|uniref:F-box protein At5g49610-like n=1 Tax=Aegilops tauschii subsp. strangulata TaxID=200361 RepID=UPI000989F3DF|nr:F-box protein At2g34280-like [Aegilops tauschii subsp. strangulata]
MAEAPTSQPRRRPFLLGLPDEIVIWEILARLDPKSLLRCRAVHRDWRRATSSRSFLLAHHARQPTLPTLSCKEYRLGVRCHDILAFDHRAATDAQLHSVAWLDEVFHQEASCDGLLLLSKFNMTASGTSFSVCNPATREHALLGQPRGFKILGMYPHRPTGEYRLLLKRRRLNLIANHSIGCYVFALGSNQPPRYIGWLEAASGVFNAPVRVRDSLH